MTVSLTSPFGSTQGTFTVLGGVEWDVINTVGIALGISSSIDFTVAEGRGGFGQGTCVSPTFAQSSGSIYWEVTWEAVSGSAAGIGVCVIPPAATQAMNVLATFYQNLASSGVGGGIIRCDGSIWVGGQQVNPPFGQGGPPPGSIPAQGSGDIIGINLSFGAGIGFVTFSVFSGGNAFFSSNFTLSGGPNFLPCVVFDSGGSKQYSVNANFGGNGAGSFFGPANFPNSFNLQGLTLGWPSSL